MGKNQAKGEAAAAEREARWRARRAEIVPTVHEAADVKSEARATGSAIVLVFDGTPEAALVPHARKLGPAWLAFVPPAELPELLRRAASASVMHAKGTPFGAELDVEPAIEALARDALPVGAVRVVVLGWGLTIAAEVPSEAR